VHHKPQGDSKSAVLSLNAVSYLKYSSTVKNTPSRWTEKKWYVWNKACI